MNSANADSSGHHSSKTAEMYIRSIGQMNMMGQNEKIAFAFLLFFILCMITGCHKKYEVTGRVLDGRTGEALSGATVYLKNIDSTRTDSDGQFFFDHYLAGGYAFTDVEIVIRKTGYQSRHVKFANDHNGNRGKFSIYMTPSAVDHDVMPARYVRLSYCFNLLISAVNILTIFFLFLFRIKWKVLWIVGVFVLNPLIIVSYIDGSVAYHIFHAPLFLLHYKYAPFSVRVAIPIIPIIFWTLYTTGRIRRSMNIAFTAGRIPPRP
jgi:hypothetical protein